MGGDMSRQVKIAVISGAAVVLAAAVAALISLLSPSDGSVNNIGNNDGSCNGNSNCSGLGHQMSLVEVMDTSSVHLDSK